MIYSRFIPLLLLLFTLISCQFGPVAPQLPTQAAAALLPTATATPIDPSLAATWTPPAPSDSAELSSTRVPRRTPQPAQPSIPQNIPTNTATASPTATATNTPLPYVSFIPTRANADELGPSKLGLHVIQNNPEVMDFVRAARPAVMKSTGDFGFLAEVKEISPYTVTIGRFPVEDQSYNGNPEDEARKMVAEQLRYYQLNPYIDFWEGWNEPDPGMERMEWYARFESERVRELARYGFRAAVGGFSTGVPEMNEFELFIPAIETAIEYHGILTLHEYSAPDMTNLYGGALPGYPSYPDRGALTFRYRWYYQEYLEPMGLVLPLAITEAGIDGIIGNRPGPPGTGWQDFQEYWVEQGRWGDDGIDAYVRQLAWYDQGLREDGYVIGATIFTAGGGVRWKSYNIEAALPRLADYINSQR